MKSSVYRLLEFTTLFALLAACSPPPATTASITPPASTLLSAPHYSVLHHFSGARNGDGAVPYANLIQLNGILYGTTYKGGNRACTAGLNQTGCGTVFQFDPQANEETVIYSFADAATDGALPTAPLIAVGGKLYGTTFEGGGSSRCNQGCGAVFEVDPLSGSARVIHNFGGGKDGARPNGGLVNLNGTLYGTTSGGGLTCNKLQHSCGTIVSIELGSGRERVVHLFNGKDGAYPAASLTLVGGRLYGTTTSGGQCFGCGIVFEFDPKTGTVRTLHAFKGSPDGADPIASLLVLKRKLYGTTSQGGPAGRGTVFSIDIRTGRESSIYAFDAKSGGWYPFAPVMASKGILYGTTSSGGTACRLSVAGCGTIFAINPGTHQEQVLHRFSGGADGTSPLAGLLQQGGAFYGTTATQTADILSNKVRSGTIFEIAP